MNLSIRILIVFAVASLNFSAVAVVRAQTDAELIAKGQKVYAEQKCSQCHSINGTGGKSGGNLSKAGATRDFDWLKQFTRAPKSLIPNAKMPAFQGSREELVAVAAYLASLK